MQLLGRLRVNHCDFMALFENFLKGFNPLKCVLVSSGNYTHL